VPKSRIRRKSVYTPPPPRTTPLANRAWVAPVMVALFLIGLAWIVTFYLTQGDLPLMDALGNWNILVGFVFIGLGFAVSTQWK
jgi:Cell division protein CrgA